MSDGKVEYDVRADTSKITSDLNAINQLVQRSAQETQKKVDNIGRAAENSIKPMTEAAGKAAESIDDLGREAGETAKDVKQLGEETEGAADKTDDLGKEAEDAAKKIREQGEQSKKSAEHTDKLRNSVDKVKDSVKDVKEQIGKYAAAAGAAFVAVGTAAVKSAADAETSFAKVKTLLSDGIMVDDYYNSIKKASANTGVGFGSIAESVYSAISASVDESKAVEFTENAVKLAKGGFTETATAVDVLTTAINAYGLAADDATHISDVLITTQNAGKTTVDELARSMGQTIPIANSANVAIEELSTMYAVMTKNGVATAESGTQIKAMLNELNASGTTVDKTLREITGKSFSELKSEGQTTADVLKTLSDYAGSSGQNLADLFGSMEAGSAAFTLVKDGGADFVNILGQMQNSAGATEKAYETMSNTIEERINKLKNRFALAFTEVGEDLLPKIEQFADYVDDHFDEISDTISGIGEATEQAAEFLLGLTKVLWDNKEAVGALVIGYVAFKSAMAIGNVITAVVSSIKAFTTAVKAGTSAQEAMNVACNANPYVLLASAIATLTVGMISLSNAIMDTGGRMDDMNAKADELIKSAKEYHEKSEKLSDVSKKYEEIQNSEAGAATKADELQSLQQELINQYGDQASGIDLVNGKYEEQAGLLEKLIDKNHELAKATADEALAEAEAAEKQASSVDAGSMLFNVDNTEIAQWAARNLSTFDAGWSMLGSTAGKTGISLSGSYEERAADWEKFYNYLTADRGLTKDNDLVKQVREQWEKMLDNADYLKSLKDAVENLDKAQEDMKDTTNSVSDAENKAAESTSDLTEKTNEAAEAEKSLKEITDDLNDSTKDIIDQYGSLYDSLKNLENGGALNYDQMMKLIEIYPELAEKISLTADGYTLEAEALGDLRGALDDSVAATIDAEREKTNAVIQGAKDRIRARYAEMSELAQKGEYGEAAKVKKEIDEAWEAVSDLESNLKHYDTLGEYVKGGKGKSASSGSSSGGSSGRSSGSSETSGKGGEAENEKAYDKEYEALKHQRDMEKIDDKTFYGRVDKLMERYLEKGSKKWNAAELDRHKWEESLKNGSGKGGDPNNEKKYDKKYKELKYKYDVGEIDAKTFYDSVDKLKDKYLEEDSDKWRSVNVDRHKWEESEKKEAKSGKGKTVISIDSYIPGVWDTEEERAEKLRKSAELGIGDYRSSIRSIQTDAATVGSTVASTAPVSSTTAETTLTDVVSAIKDMQSADEHKKISFEVELKARDLTIGKVCVADINDMTRASGKTPLIIK